MWFSKFKTHPYFIKLQSFLFLDYLGRFYYRIGLKIFVYVLKYSLDIKSIYVRHSFAKDAWIPWISDIDLTVVIDQMSSEIEIKFLKKFTLIHKILKIPFPFIEHVDIFNQEELKLNFLYDDPLLNGYVSDWKLLKGNEVRRKIVAHHQENTFGLRVQHWAVFMPLLFRDKFDNRMYVRKYYKFFEKFLCFGPEYNLENLGCLLNKARGSNFLMNNPEDFVLKSYYYSINILGNAFKRQNNLLAQATRFKFVDTDVDFGGAFLKEIGVFTESLAGMKNLIRSVFVDPGTIQNNKYRIWIIVDNHIKEKEFIDLFKRVKINAGSFIREGIYPYVFFENTLNFLLMNRWFWPFEYDHLRRHAHFIYGEKLFRENNRPSDSSLLEMSYKYGFLLKYRLRNVMNYTKEELQKFLWSVLNRRLFLEKMYITTTPKELINAYVDLLPSKETGWVSSFLSNQKVSKSDFYSRMRTILELDSFIKFPVGDKVFLSLN
ncbi:MAG: hypothetical protein WCH62_05295 [Candidatus Omnitrophota bacterium]